MTQIPSLTSELDRFYALANFRLAWFRIRNSDRIEVKDRLALNLYAMNPDILLEKLVRKIRSGEYHPEAPQRIFTPKKARTLRPFPFLSMEDRLVYQAIGNIIIQNSYADLSEYADRRVFAHLPQEPDSLFTLRSSKSRINNPGQFEKYRDAIIAARQAIRDEAEDSYVVKTDIASFYPSIDHDLLIKVLRQHHWLNEKSLLTLLHDCLEAWSSHNPTLNFRRGVPIGYETSDILATQFLFDIDQEMVNYCTMLRYVDDMYLFSNNKAEATHALIQLDRLLQERALILQTAKTDFERLSNSEIDDEYGVELELQEQLSLVSLDLNGGKEDTERAQQSLYDLFIKLWGSEKRLEKYEAKFAFILYRLRSVNTFVRDIALELIDELPNRIVHITQYLSQFQGDAVVINILSRLVDDERGYAQVRAECLRTLAIISPNRSKIKTTAKLWYRTSHDWYLRLVAVDILQNFKDEFNFLRQITRTEKNTAILASAFVACFQLTDRYSDKVEIVRAALNDENEFINLLGIYLFRRDSLVWDDINPSKLVPHEFKLLSDSNDETLTETVEFRETLKSICDFEISPLLPIQELFDDIPHMTQLLQDISDARETNPNSFVRAAIDFSKCICLALPMKPIKPENIFPEHILEKLEDWQSSRIWELIRAAQKLPNKSTTASVLSGKSTIVIPTARIRPLLQVLSSTYAHIFSELHTKYDIVQPATLQAKAPNGPMPKREHVFVSHKRMIGDNEFSSGISEFLGNHGIKTWLDLNDLPYGDEWDDQVESQGLDSAHSMIVVATPESMASPEVKNEWNYAKLHSLLVIVVVLRECKITYRLARNNHIDATQDVDNALNQLVDRLSKHIKALGNF